MTALTTALPNPLRLFYYVGTPSLPSLQANAANIDALSPNFFRLDKQGTITGVNQPAVTDFARARGIKILPMLQNDAHKDEFNLLMAQPLKVRAILDKIERLVVDLDYEGFHIDFEDLNAASEVLLTGFMRQLHDRLNSHGKLTTMAVVSRTDASTNVFSAAYNYRALAPWLDLVTIMTYDFAWPMGNPGPVAPINEQERIMNFAISCFGADKCLLGIPFYGYDWNLAKLSPVRQRAASRTYPEIVRLRQDTNGSLSYNAAAETPLLEYILNGEKHQVWFEDPRSLAAKLGLMNRLGVRGLAAWRLGHEGPEFWPALAGVSRSGPRFFPETGQTIQGDFRRFWEANGGLPQFGFPITAEIEKTFPETPPRNLKMQYMERARFEFHPELGGSGPKVLLGLLGREVTSNREFEPPFLRVADPQRPPLIRFFPETGHTLKGAFREYWDTHGGLVINGFPISEEFLEASAPGGSKLTVQYFERSRFELHLNPDGTLKGVMLGLLGRQDLDN